MFSKIFPIKICTLLHAFEAIVEALLPQSECISRTCILTASTASSAVEKHWPLILFFTFGNKKSHSVPSQDYTADDSSKRCFECSKRQLFEPMCKRSSHCRGEEWSVFGGWFSWFLGRQLANKWNWLFCIVLMVRLQHVQFFRKNRRSFAWKSFVSEQLLLDLDHLETPIQSFAVYFRAHRRKSTIYHLSRCHRRVLKPAIVFLENFFRLTNCVGSNANKFLWQSNIHAILN